MRAADAPGFGIFFSTLCAQSEMLGVRWSNAPNARLVEQMFTIRKAKQEDKEPIWRVHVKAVRETCVSHYSQEVIRVWAERLQPEKYEEAIRSNDFFVAEEDGAIVGFGELDRAGGEIQGLYVSPDVASRGVGWKLLDTLEERARAFGLGSLNLRRPLMPFPSMSARDSRHLER